MRQRQRRGRIAGNHNRVRVTDADQAVDHCQNPRDQNVFPQPAIRESGIVGGINQAGIAKQPRYLCANGQSAETESKIRIFGARDIDKPTKPQICSAAGPLSGANGMAEDQGRFWLMAG